jgi:branched-chain amino acid transport system ATP-binding protein
VVGLVHSLATRAGLRKPRPPRELAFIPRRPSGGVLDFHLGRFGAPPGALLGAFRQGLVESRPAGGDAAGAAADTSPTALDVRSVAVAFGGVQALAGISLRVEPGELVGIIGPNGAGKTTLFNVCSGFQAPGAGRVLLDGEDITGLPPHRRALAGLGRTFQTPRLVASMSVFENLLVAAHPRLRYGLPAEVAGFSYALRDETEERARVRQLLRVLGLSSLADRAAGDLPSGLGKVVEVARALVTEPRVLLLDEPSAGLDRTETRWLGDLIRAVTGELGVAVALIEHDMSLVMGVSDYIYVLDAGRRLAAGRPSEIRSDARVVDAYLGREVFR